MVTPQKIKKNFLIFSRLLYPTQYYCFEKQSNKNYTGGCPCKAIHDNNIKANRYNYDKYPLGNPYQHMANPMRCAPYDFNTFGNQTIIV